MDPIEELRQIVVQGFASVHDKIDAVDARLSGKIDAVDARLSGKIGAVDTNLSDRMDTLEAKMNAGFARVDEDLAFVRRAVLDHVRELRDIRTALDKKVDRDEVEAIVERAVMRAIGS